MGGTNRNGCFSLRQNAERSGTPRFVGAGFKTCGGKDRVSTTRHKGKSGQKFTSSILRVSSRNEPRTRRESQKIKLEESML